MDVDQCQGLKCFSLAIVRDGKLVGKYEKLPLHRLIRLIWEYKPKVIALDNIYELAQSERELARLLSLLPDDVDVVQVTRMPDGEYVDLRVVASMAGIDVGSGKLTPSKTAYVVALLAEKGFGSRVKFVEEKTKIVISRARSLGSGGMSQSRYQRKVRAAILRVVKEIKSRLDKAKLDYDLIFRKGGGGLDSAVFIVYAPRSRLRGIVKPYHGMDVKVEIKPVYSSHIYFEVPLKYQGPRRYIIIGIDPGVSTAVAAVDLEGRVVLALSRKGLDRGDIIELVHRVGRPVMVASDVKPAPEFVKRLASSLGVPVFEPPESLSIDEKRKIVEEVLNKQPELRSSLDAHIRDALAAALKALQSYQSKFKQIEAYVSRLGLEVDVDNIKALVLRGMSVAEAVEQEIMKLLAQEGEAGVVVKKVRKSGTEHGEKDRSLEESIAKLREELERLKAENAILKRRVRELEQALKEATSSYELLKREFSAQVEADRLVATLRREVEILRRELDKVRNARDSLETKLRELLEDLLLAGMGRAIVAPVLRSLTMESLKDAKKLCKGELKSLLIYLAGLEPVDSEAVDAIAREGVLGIVAPSDIANKCRAIFEPRGIPVIDADDLVVRVYDDFALVSRDAIEIASIRRAEIMLSRRAEENRHLDITKLKELIREYRMMRFSELQDEDYATTADGPGEGEV